ncbi:MAG: hypothetical protein GYB64_12195 [Chloroflexi bacterium]|nr:hypothetical protein [Chloroflexota bacterium]
MTCDHIEPLLAAYLDGELTPQEEARVADCLAQNGDLRREAEQLAAARDHLTQMMTASMVAAEAPHAAWPGIAARLDQTGPATNRHNPAVDTPRRDALRRQPASGLLAPLFAAGTAALLLVLVGLVVWNGFAPGAASVGAIETPTLVPESTPVPAPIERIAGPSGDPAVPAPAAAADGPFEAITVAFGDVARLEGYRIGDRLADGRLVVDLLWWVAGDAPGLNEVMLVQDADGNLVMQFEADLPASGPAQYVLRTEGLPPGDYTLLVGVTDRADRIPAGDAPQAVAVFTVDGAPQAEELATPTLTIDGFTEAVLDTAALPT